MDDRSGRRPGSTTRAALLDAALRLFADQGYAATSIVQIEEAAGLTPGAGGLYRHFRSKEELLGAAIERVQSVPPPTGEVDRAFDPALDLDERLVAVARTVLATLDVRRDLTRLVFRDLDQFPTIMERVRQGVDEPYRLLGQWCAMQPEAGGGTRDWTALGAVLGASLVYHWLFADQFGAPVADVERERFVATWVTTARQALIAT